MRGYRLSPQAEQTLEDVISWTIEHFGVGQAERYKDQLISRLAELAANEMPHGLTCSGLLAGQRDVVDLEYYREGRHYIIYRNTFDEILVLDFVHGSRDLKAILDELS
ncbi:type II toxin-antitoxin system RelE/ParE family toxin [Congregibacter litoralis]|uniref:Plasmid stabilization system protein n=1 Tax=Congregibacter litoralis KT71 TaxID=314285 RepID=A4A4S6_9GAMM|nr:type II toxin-antitoxin system RelE/ParE family toxin [Congregibacter litoralis]EAQ98797.1 Plasmid stabilization system protein [Congregibacter litoralis KT71]